MGLHLTLFWNKEVVLGHIRYVAFENVMGYKFFSVHVITLIR
jgi:hypothetical protein